MSVFWTATWVGRWVSQAVSAVIQLGLTHKDTGSANSEAPPRMGSSGGFGRWGYSWSLTVPHTLQSSCMRAALQWFGKALAGASLARTREYGMLSHCKLQIMGRNACDCWTDTIHPARVGMTLTLSISLAASH